ncbi:MAG: hypothetical protein JST42_25455 [Bacteroidetes bacterium]|nr:hypothetical protein [Bacteroidota bacterium]
MRRLATILLMGILFFNWYGYQLITIYWQDRADRRLEASLDRKDYAESQLISLKVAITSLSYYNSTTDFQRVDGQIDIGGVQYKYVERRILQDSIEYRCIPNQMAIRLKNVKDSYFQLVNDLSRNGQEKKTPHSTQYKSVSQDYCATSMAIELPHMVAVLAPKMAATGTAHLPSSYSPAAELPPDRASL